MFSNFLSITFAYIKQLNIQKHDSISTEIRKSNVGFTCTHKSRYDFVQATATTNGFDKGNIIRLASFLLKNKECSTWSESMSKAWELAKGRNAQFVKQSISDYSFWTKGN